jgi:UDP-N-acetylmuramate--alanine ligase
VLNSLAAITVARELGVSDHRIRTAFSAFEGVRRRFSRVGEWNGAAIIDDYGHNPFKIAAALKAARQAYAGPIVAIVQPHRYSRLRDTFEQFCTCLNDADTAIITPVYSAGEQPIEGITHITYADAVRAHGHKNVLTIESPEELPDLVSPFAEPGGAIIFLGAGSSTNWANGLEAVLKAREGRQ